MYASEVIRDLQKLIDERGDLELENERGELTQGVEYNDDEGPCFLITFE